MSNPSADPSPRLAADFLRLTSTFFASKGLPQPRLEAELLLAHVLGITRLKLFMDLERPLDEREIAAYREAVRRRARRVPLAYITNRREFLGFEFEVTADVLVPRPETEHLIEAVAAALAQRAPHASASARRWFAQAAITLQLGEEESARIWRDLPTAQQRALAAAGASEAAGGGTAPLRFADIGTGSGIVAICLCRLYPEIQGVAVDLSPQALEVARRNAARHQVQARLEFRQGHLLEPLRSGDTCAALDLVVANLPYVEEGEMAGLEPELHHEPRMALAAGADGLALIRELIAQAPTMLLPGGILALEIGHRQGAAVRDLMEAAGFVGVHVRKDLAGHDRVVMGARAGEA